MVDSITTVDDAQDDLRDWDLQSAYFEDDLVDTPQLSEKQAYALTFLDPEHPCKFLFYGGAAGGGKSVLGCYWLMGMCDTYAGTRWFIGRDSLKDSRESVLVTFRKVAKSFNYTDWKYADNEIAFKNGSTITFLDLSFYPQKDPMFERLGSKEYTGGWIEEAGEVHAQAFETLKTRIGRHMNREYKIRPKILITANPKKNWIYSVFYKPYMRGDFNRIKTYAFIPAMYYDNPFLDIEYVRLLFELTDKVKIERLRNGNFEYDDNPYMLCTYDNIRSIFGGNAIATYGRYYLTADIARLGADKAVIVVWDGFKIVNYSSYDVSLTTDIAFAIEYYRNYYHIPKNRCIADQDGVGGGVVDQTGIIGFVNGAVAFKKREENEYDHETGQYKENQNEEHFMNLQSQCGYLLAEYINSNAIGFSESVAQDMDEDLKDTITVDLEQLQAWEPDKERKGLRIKPKEAIKETINRSPDWRDVLLMRMYFVYAEDDTYNYDGLF